MPHVTLRSIFLPALLVLTVTGCSREADPDSPEGMRQAAFKHLLSHSEPMAGMLNGRIAFDPQVFALHAKALEDKADAPWHYFPEPGDSDQPTAARDSVWSDPAGFTGRIEQFRSATSRLAAVALDGIDSPDQVREPLQAVLQTCKACHEQYRQ